MSSRVQNAPTTSDKRQDVFCASALYTFNTFELGPYVQIKVGLYATFVHCWCVCCDRIFHHQIWRTLVMEQRVVGTCISQPSTLPWPACCCLSAIDPASSDDHMGYSLLVGLYHRIRAFGPWLSLEPSLRVVGLIEWFAIPGSSDILCVEHDVVIMHALMIVPVSSSRLASRLRELEPYPLLENSNDKDLVMYAFREILAHGWPASLQALSWSNTDHGRRWKEIREGTTCRYGEMYEPMSLSLRGLSWRWYTNEKYYDQIRWS